MKNIYTDWDFRYADTVYDFVNGVFTIIHHDDDLQPKGNFSMPDKSLLSMSIFYCGCVLGLIALSNLGSGLNETLAQESKTQFEYILGEMLSVVVMVLSAYLIPLSTRGIYKLIFKDEADKTMLLWFIVSPIAFTAWAISGSFIVFMFNVVVQGVWVALFRKDMDKSRIVQTVQNFFKKIEQSELRKQINNMEFWESFEIKGMYNKNRKVVFVTLPTFELGEFRIKQFPEGIIRRVNAYRTTSTFGNDKEDYIFNYTIKVEFIKELQDNEMIIVEWR